MANTSSATLWLWTASGANRSPSTVPLWTATGSTTVIANSSVVHALWTARGVASSPVEIPAWEAWGQVRDPCIIPLWTVQGTTARNGESDAELPLWVAAAVGSIGHASDAELPLWTAAAAGLSGIMGGSIYVRPTELWDATGQARTAGTDTTGTTAITFRMWTATGVGVAGRVGSSAVDLPFFTVDGHGYPQYTGQSDIEWPTFLADGTAIQTTGATYAGLALNTSLRRQTTLSGWAFNSMAELNGSLLGVTDAGLFEITGDDDDGADIDATVRTHVMDFGSAKHKRAGSLVAGLRADGDLRVTVTVDEHDEHEYVLEAPGHETLSNARVKIGKGLVGRYWQFQLENIDGADFELDQTQCDMAELSRRLP